MKEPQKTTAGSQEPYIVVPATEQIIQKKRRERMQCMKTNTLEHGEEVRDKIMDAIIQYIDEHQYAPTVREIGDMVGLKSTSSVHAHLTRLISERRLETDTDNILPRAIRVPGYKYQKVETII